MDVGSRKELCRSRGPGADWKLRKMRNSSVARAQAGEKYSSGEIRWKRLPSVQAL